ncbi:hypothetical protein DVK00_20075 [Haloarcula sp. Atlit-47R]|uniref:hypothetical protein n=1 Tax=Haloarcula sp. Atlit-47R TaxID=2282132 RepID=UPI000EF1A22B|nr:hypothetical protein [Haloarcula sp. Atlit-47R]RLM41288.1 hypothetical protein DVK00_20075 [Haloarcula sp. Atlit-47R]
MTARQLDLLGVVVLLFGFVVVVPTADFSAAIATLIVRPFATNPVLSAGIVAAASSAWLIASFIRLERSGPPMPPMSVPEWLADRLTEEETVNK